MRRERFLTEQERIMLWSDLLAALAPFYPKGEEGGRPAADWAEKDAANVHRAAKLGAAR